jgi:uncharacterized protein (TIGR03083 family)
VTETTTRTVDLHDADVMIAALRASHQRLDALTATLGDDALTAPTQLPDWPVAQVLSHLGSGAEIGLDLVGRAVGGVSATIDRDAMTAIWDRWNAMTLVQQRDGRREQDDRHLQALERLDGDQRRDLRVPYFVGPLTVAEYVGYRLSEHAVHTWDVAVALDPGARIDPAAVPVLWARLGRIAERFTSAETRQALAPADVTFRPTDGMEPATLRITADSLAWLPGAGLDATVQVRGAAESLVRLVYGRLDPARRAHDRLEVSGGLALDTLRELFPGY